MKMPKKIVTTQNMVESRRICAASSWSLSIFFAMM